MLKQWYTSGGRIMLTVRQYMAFRLLSQAFELFPPASHVAEVCPSTLQLPIFKSFLAFLA